ncbi:PDGLE domain-containing protein [Haloechinothrix salitolerans]|uniref:PDGLE domain-containing protein n=1 Tax=Haloechinothrix salitolerans TaxID=926830 RepID=A0ABW2BZL8_9PSEU
MSRVSLRRFALVAVVVTAVLAIGVSAFASASPDGLEWALRDGCTSQAGELRGTCPAQHEREHALGEFALDGTGLAAGVGTALVLLLVWGGVALMRGRGARE